MLNASASASSRSSDGSAFLLLYARSCGRFFAHRRPDTGGNRDSCDGCNGKSTTGSQLKPFDIPQTMPTLHPRLSADDGAIEERSSSCNTSHHFRC